MKLRESDDRAEPLAKDQLAEHGIIVLRRGSEFPRLTAATVVCRLASSDGVLVVDPGERRNRAKIAELLAADGIRPEDVGKVVCTHFHYDHVENLDLFPNAQLYMSSQELAVADEIMRLPDEDIPAFVESQAERVKPAYTRLTLNALRTNRVHLEAVPRMRDRFVFVDEETEIADGVRVVPTPGHTKGHVSVLIGGGDLEGAAGWASDGAVWIAGDAWPSSRFAPDSDSGELPFCFSSATFRQTLSRMVKRSRAIVPGHGRPFYWRA